MVRALSLTARVFAVFYLTAGAILPAADKSGESAEPVGLFEAIAAGDVEVKLILKDSTTGTAIVANKTKRPLAIILPEAFAGVPVAAQFGANPFGNGNNAGNPGNNASQTVGAAPQNPWGNNNAGPGIFNVGPERAIKLKVSAVCLEHGKKEPNSRIAYELVPLASFTSDKRVADLVSMLGKGEVDQPAAQAAAWHLTDGLSWQQLRKEIGIKHLSGQNEPYFTAGQIERAKKIVGRPSATGQSEN